MTFVYANELVKNTYKNKLFIENIFSIYGQFINITKNEPM